MIKSSQIRKPDLVDFVHRNILFSKKRKPKKDLNKCSKEQLLSFIEKANCMEYFEEWLKAPKPIIFYVDGEEDGDLKTWECSYISIEECRNAFEAEGIKVNNIIPKSNAHICKYCNGIAYGTDKEELCEDCQMLFGHRYYYEL